MKRREVFKMLLMGACGMTGAFDALSAVASTTSQGGSRTQPAGLHEIAGVPWPHTDLTAKAVALARDACEPSLFNHCARSYCFAALMAKNKQWQVDHEVMLLASILHDLGLTKRYQGPDRFEAQGADAAHAFLIQNGLDEARATVVSNAILMHASSFIAERQQREVALVSMGVGTDVVGGFEMLAQSQVDKVVETFPRLQFKKAFVADCTAVVRRYPDAAGGFMRDIGLREIPGFHPHNICDAIAKAPFAE
ncbi:MAG TPA: HD domain-containing protein [Rhodanobacteraceae bacterium]|nr:HD domain-containing protein [Rhodanobacteraceae bacterium]